MAAMLSLNADKAFVFRAIHRDNLPWLLEHGLHCRRSQVIDPKYVEIGNPDLIGKRQGRRVPIPPGGTLSDYVPFYFTPRSPMLLNIKTDLRFQAHRFGPFAPRLTHLLDALDGSYLHSDKRIADAGPLDVIRFDDAKRDRVAAFLQSEGKNLLPSLEATAAVIDGFETPLGMDLLATVDWLVVHGGEATLAGVKAGLASWTGGADAGVRKLRLFDDRMVEIALEWLRAQNSPPCAAESRTS